MIWARDDRVLGWSGYLPQTLMEEIASKVHSSLELQKRQSHYIETGIYQDFNGQSFTSN